MILVDLSHTSHTRARTGVQRVCRRLYRALSAKGETSSTLAGGSDPNRFCEPVTWDPYARTWRALEAPERRLLDEEGTAKARGARWPWRARLQGRVTRWLNRPATPLPAADGLIVPEIFSPAVASALPALFAKNRGPRIALFHDAIALKLPELTPAKTVARFPGYLRELLQFDGVAAVSDDSRTALIDWWRWLGIQQPPEVIALPLGIDPPAKDTVLARTSSVPILLSVGSLEGRKNHLALLEACETLWQQGHAFELRLIGLVHPQTGRTALDCANRLQASGRPIRYDGAVDDRSLNSAYHECAFTVYPSLMEGFGLPVLESLSYGKPCICSARGALGESTRGGGCLALPAVDASSLASAIGWLLTKPDHRAQLAFAARARVNKTWSTYADELLAWMNTLKKRLPTTR